MKEPQYILHIIVTNISYTPSPRAWSNMYYINGTLITRVRSNLHWSCWPLVFQKMRVKELSGQSYDMV